MAVLTDSQRTDLRQRLGSQRVHPMWPYWRFQLWLDNRTRSNMGLSTEVDAGVDDEVVESDIASEWWRHAYKESERGLEGAAGGRQSVGGLFAEARGTTAQVPGLFPWAVGSGAPIVGTPLGAHLTTGMPVCYDATNWMVRGGFITAPVTLVIALNGFGKSSMVRKMVNGSVAQKRTTLVLGDPKPDYRVQCELLGGQTATVGYGHQRMNPLDPGAMGKVIARISAARDEVYQTAVERDELDLVLKSVRADLLGRQVTTVAGLIELVRGRALDDFETTLLRTGIELLYAEYGFDHDHPPILQELRDLLIAGHPELYADAGLDDPKEWTRHELGTPLVFGPEKSREREKYEDAILPLRRSINSLVRGEFGSVFNSRENNVRLDLDSPMIDVDVSRIPRSEHKLRGAVLLTAWAEGMAAVEGAHVLADVGLAPMRTFHVVIEEMWDVISLGEAMVDRVSELTRLNRGIGTELTMITHSVGDGDSLGSESARTKARGIFERSRVKIIGPIPRAEVNRLKQIISFSNTEVSLVTGWATPEALTGEPARPGEQAPPPPGMGKFLIKVGEGEGPGIPFQTVFTPSESASGMHDTNTRFAAVNAARAAEAIGAA